MNIDKLIEQHFSSSLEEEILKYFNYESNWRYLPLTDERETYWSVSDGEIFYQDEPLIEHNGVYNARVIGAPYRKGDYVLIAYDTECDRNEYLGIFRSDREYK